MKDWKELCKEAEMVALSAHKNMTYDIFPYEKHLRDVVRNLERFGYVNEYVVAGWLHDVVEDAHISLGKISRAFGLPVAKMIQAVTDRNDLLSRREKKEWTYKKLQQNPDGLIIKLADRIANVEHSIRMNNKDKTIMYAEEQPKFEALCRTQGHADEMWEYLNKVLAEQTVS